MTQVCKEKSGLEVSKQNRLAETARNKSHSPEKRHFVWLVRLKLCKITAHKSPGEMWNDSMVICLVFSNTACSEMPVQFKYLNDLVLSSHASVQRDSCKFSKRIKIRANEYSRDVVNEMRKNVFPLYNEAFNDYIWLIIKTNRCHHKYDKHVQTCLYYHTNVCLI